MLSPYASVVEKLHKDTDKEKVTMLKIERAGDVLADTPAKVAQSILLFCKGQGLLTSVVMPGVDRQRAFSTSSGGSNGEPRRLSRGKLNRRSELNITIVKNCMTHDDDCGFLLSFSFFSSFFYCHANHRL